MHDVSRAALVLRRDAVRTEGLEPVYRRDVLPLVPLDALDRHLREPLSVPARRRAAHTHLRCLRGRSARLQCAQRAAHHLFLERGVGLRDGLCLLLRGVLLELRLRVEAERAELRLEGLCAGSAAHRQAQGAGAPSE